MKAMHTKSLTPKVLAIISFLSLIAALVAILLTPLASGYELTIYDAFPWHFWLFIWLGVSSATGILIYQSIVRGDSNWGLLGLFAVLLSNGVLLGLPFFHGYTFYGEEDALIHLGNIQDIIMTGHIGVGNFYPIVHLLGAEVAFATGVSRELISQMFHVVFYAFYMLNIYLLATMIGSSRKQAFLIIAFASPLVFSNLYLLIHPSVLSLFMVPLLLYFRHRRDLVTSGVFEATVAALIVVVAITFTHPITTFFTIVVLLSIDVAAILCRRIEGANMLLLVGGAIPTRNLNIVGITVIIFFTWYFSFAYFQSSFSYVFHSLLGEGKASLIENQLQQLTKANLTMSQTIEMFLWKYGAISLFALISAASVILVLKDSIHRKASLRPVNIAYSLQFACGFAVFLIFVLGYFIEYNPLRVSRFFLVLAPVISGLAFYDLIDKLRAQRRWNGLLVGLIGLLILMMNTLGIFNVHPSPKVILSNWQVTSMEMSGSRWFIDREDNNVSTVTAATWIGHFNIFNYGDSAARVGPKVDPSGMPSHLGYDKNSSAVETFKGQDRYLITGERDRLASLIYPENLSAVIHQYAKDDFDRLRSDPAVTQIYTNGEFEVWRAYGE